MLKIRSLSHKSIDTSRFRWSWKEFGTGPRLMLAFHGFNRNSDDFIPFSKHLSKTHTILAFDLLYHGGSALKGKDDYPFFTLDELKDAFELILDQYGKREFEVIAHSFGGRLAFNLVEVMGDRIRGLYLMAPDALRFNPGYWLASQTWLGQKLMHNYRHKPKPVSKILKAFGRIGLISVKAADFYISQITFGPVREKIHLVWMAHRKTIVNQKLVTDTIKHHHIPTLLFLGNFDSIIPQRSGQRFIRRSGCSATLVFLEVGHRVHEKHQEICDHILRSINKEH